MYHPGKTPLAGQTIDWQASARFGGVFSEMHLPGNPPIYVRMAAKSDGLVIF